MPVSIFKALGPDDEVANKTLLYEVIPMTGALLSGTYGGNGTDLGSEPHIKTYSHGMFTSVYDYPYLSSSANHILDISVGFSAGNSASATTGYLASGLSGSADTGDTALNDSIGAANQQEKKINMYNQMCQLLNGYDINNNIANFDEDGVINNTVGETKINSAVFLSFSRLLVKDEIKKGNFQISMAVSSSYSAPGGAAGDAAFRDKILITDTNAENNFFTTSPAGEFGILYADTSTGNPVLVTDDGTQKVGLVYYQAGIAVLTSSLFVTGSKNKVGHPGLLYPNTQALHGGHTSGQSNARSISASYSPAGNGDDFVALLTGSTIQKCTDFVRSRINNIQFNNTTELNSRIYFCRARHNEYNYSSNRTYLDGSKIRVKDIARDPPKSYITTIGLYSGNHELLAVAKLSEPIRKDPTNEVTLRVRLDY